MRAHEIIYWDQNVKDEQQRQSHAKKKKKPAKLMNKINEKTMSKRAALKPFLKKKKQKRQDYVSANLSVLSPSS